MFIYQYADEVVPEPSEKHDCVPCDKVLFFPTRPSKPPNFTGFSITKAYALASENVAKFPRLESREDAFSLF